MGMQDGNAQDRVVVFEPFEDYGNAPEFNWDSLSAFEVLDGNIIRLFVTRIYRNKRELAYTCLTSLESFCKLQPKAAVIRTAALRATSPELWEDGMSATPN